MSITGDRLKELRVKKGKTLAQMAKETGLGVSAISNYENGIRMPKKVPMEVLTDYFNVDTDYVLGKSNMPRQIDLTGIFEEGYHQGERDMQEKLLYRSIPIYSCINCGTGKWIDEYPDDRMTVPDCMVSAGKEYFANPAEGDSMEPKIHNGDLLIFEETPIVESGDIGAFSLNGEYYCKRFKRLPNDSVWLFSDNAAYDPIPIGPDDNFRVLGKYKMRLTRD